ncbi:MAG: ferrous iron transport protein B [Chloroflexota bacterium]|nr:ferrous iron transport protein B [Chloroflexota bacterium]
MKGEIEMAQEAIAKRISIVDYGRDIEEEISELEKLIAKIKELTAIYPARWLAVKLLENDSEVKEKVKAVPGGAEILRRAEASMAHLRDVFGDEAETVIADRRYGFISGLTKRVLRKPAVERLTTSDKIDKIVTNRVLGIPIFLAAMWLVFQFVACSGPYSDWLDGVLGGPICRWGVAILNVIGLGGTWVESLWVDGIVAGFAGVMVFVPLMFFLYFALAILEDSGYMARIAFVMDRLMKAIGLHGKSFMPLIIGFGCTVPATYATRTMREWKDRIVTAQVASLMSCGARLPVYTLFAAAFFPDNPGTFILALYLFGIFWAIVMAKLFRGTVFAGGERAPFVLELPPYRMPTLKGIVIHMWERSAYFFRKAVLIILTVSIVLWFLLNIPWGVEEMGDSLFAKVSGAIAPVLAPMGSGNWEAAGSLVTGFIAKEVVVGTMGEIYVGAEEEEAEEPTTFLEDLGEIVVGFWNATVDTVKSIISIIPGVNLMGEEEEEEETELVQALREHFMPLQAVAFNVFVLLYIPCMVAVAAFRSEYGTKWALFNAGYLTALGWTVSTLIYQIGLLLGFG